MDTPIGFRRTDNNWSPIYETRKGMIATAAIMSCSDCGRTISSGGGPGYNCVCPTCFDKLKLVNFAEGNKPL
jgi:hypothetical protein